ncbi:IspD/TarI family cytidylyltransferase [Mycolicibacterium parafortuitum]|uniref:IspD/TarI family cytidylyltransferase n=1 Tax=Mycolicibacterium parafortuitum TaxID=39692 RepID=UPI0032C45D10
MTLTALVPVPMELQQRPDAVFAPIAGQSVLARIVRTLASVADVALGGVVVAVAEPLAPSAAAALAGIPAVRVVTAAAPGRRRQCIAAGLQDIGGGSVLLHDLAWPLIAEDTLGRVTAALRDGADAVLPACAVTDSIKDVDNSGAVAATLDRSALRTVQYPRGFDVAVLARLLDTAGADDFDELAAVLTSGAAVTVVDGDTTTSRFELPDDAGYLAAVIASR